MGPGLALSSGHATKVPKQEDLGLLVYLVSAKLAKTITSLSAHSEKVSLFLG